MFQLFYRRKREFVFELKHAPGQKKKVEQKKRSDRVNTNSERQNIEKSNMIGFCFKVFCADMKTEMCEEREGKRAMKKRYTELKPAG